MSYLGEPSKLLEKGTIGSGTECSCQYYPGPKFTGLKGCGPNKLIISQPNNTTLTHLMVYRELIFHNAYKFISIQEY